MDECQGEPPAASAVAAVSAAERKDGSKKKNGHHEDADSPDASTAVFMSRTLPARVELPECDICRESLGCSEAAARGGGEATEAKESRLPRLLPCGHSYCTRCIQMGLEANGGLLQCPDRCTIDPSQRPASALKLPKNFSLMKTIEAQADREAMTELAALPCQQCDPTQPRLPAQVHCNDCSSDYCNQHDDEAHAAAQLAAHRRSSIAAHAAQLRSAAAAKKQAAFAAAAAANKLAAKAEESKAKKAMSNAQKQKDQLPKALDCMAGVVESAAKELVNAADRLRSDFKQHRQAVTAASQQLTDRAADLKSLSRSAQLVQHASDFDANLGFARLQRDSQRVHEQVEQAAQDAGRSFDLDILLSLQPLLSLQHLQRQSLILDADLAAKLASFLRGPQIQAPPELLYRGSRDGFKHTDLLRCCANKGPTLTLVAGNGFMFGAYTHCSWPAAEGTVADPTGRSFLFSLVNGSDAAVRFSLRDKDRAIRVTGRICFGADNVDGKTVGYPNFILMWQEAADQKDANAANNTTLDDTPYQLDDPTVVCNDTFLAGQHFFATAEIEVFQL